MSFSNLTRDQKAAAALIYYTTRKQYYDQYPGIKSLQTAADFFASITTRNKIVNSILNFLGLAVQEIPVEEGRQAEWIQKANDELAAAGIDTTVFRFDQNSDLANDSKFDLFPGYTRPDDDSYRLAIETALESGATTGELMVYNQLKDNTIDYDSNSTNVLERYFNNLGSSIENLFADFQEGDGVALVIQGGNTTEELLSVVTELKKYFLAGESSSPFVVTLPLEGGGSLRVQGAWLNDGEVALSFTQTDANGYEKNDTSATLYKDESGKFPIKYIHKTTINNSVNYEVIEIPNIDETGHYVSPHNYMEFVRDGDALSINGVSLVPGATPSVLDYDLRMIPTDNPGVYSYDLSSISKDGAALTATFAEVLKKDIRNQVQLQLKEMTLFQDFTEESGFDAFLAGDSGIRNVDFVEFGDGSFGYQTFDEAGELIAVTKTGNGKAVRQTMSGETEVRETFAPDGTHDVEVSIGDSYVSAGQIGSIFGSTIGRQLSDDALGSIALGTILGAAGQNLLQILGFSALDGNSVGDAINDAFGDFGIDLTNAAKGAVSSFLVGELMAEIGIDGIAGEVVNTVGGDALATIANNILGGASTSAEIFSGIDPTTVMASFVGAKLASEVVNFDTLGGQIGASAGSSIGVVLAAKDVIFTSLGPFGLLVGAFVGFIVGGVVGSLFGGTPRSGADVIFDPATGEFDVNNVWAKKGGSKEAAEGLAAAAAEALNGVLGLIGGAVANEGRVSGGTYGLRKSDYTYRVDGGAFGPGDPGKRTIARTFDGDEEDAAAQLIEHGVLNALDDLRIAGGDVYLKRALYNSLDSLLAGDDVPAGLEGEALGALYGNLATAGDYKTYVENAANDNGPVNRRWPGEIAA